jgi:hypothetical protein
MNTVMLNKIDRALEITNWSRIREDIKKANPDLAEIIDELSPNNKYKLIRAKYCFGDLIIKNGELRLPSKEGLLFPLSHPEADKSFSAFFNYSSIPLGILLNKASEVFLTDRDAVIPLKFLAPGEMFGTFEILNHLISHKSAPHWTISAGSRSVFSLPKISDAIGLKHLRKYYNLKSDQHPTVLADHWYFFKQIANHPNFEQPWYSDVIFFTEDWFAFSEKKDPAWQKFQLFLFKKGWSQSQQIFEKQNLGFLYKMFIEKVSKRYLPSSPYLIDTLKHLFLICIGSGLAFQSTCSSDVIAPSQGLESAILNIYGLKKYSPTLMNAVTFSSTLHRSPLYYSLIFPLITEGSADKKFRTSTLMQELKCLKNLIEIIKSDKNFAENTFLKNKQFDFFHAQPDIEKEIKLSPLILEKDPQFTNAKFQRLPVCATSPFWRGCIQIQDTGSS